MKRNISYIIIIYFLLVLAACSESKTPSDVIDDKKYITELIGNIERGDTIAYNEGFSGLRYTWPTHAFLIYSLKMANKYDYPKAYYDVYFLLSQSNTGEYLTDMDNKTRDLALYYLLKSYEKGYSYAEKELIKVFNQDSIPLASGYFLERFVKE